MSPAWAEGLLVVLAVYFVIGALLATAIAFLGLARIDSGASGMPWSARLLILPGLVALWPLMLVKCLKREAPPVS
jgi:hypothetical protein